jgi:hypothetical protein
MSNTEYPVKILPIDEVDQLIPSVLYRIAPAFPMKPTAVVPFHPTMEAVSEFPEPPEAAPRQLLPFADRAFNDTQLLPVHVGFAEAEYAIAVQFCPSTVAYALFS